MVKTTKLKPHSTEDTRNSPPINNEVIDIDKSLNINNENFVDNFENQSKSPEPSSLTADEFFKNDDSNSNESSTLYNNPYPRESLGFPTLADINAKDEEIIKSEPIDASKNNHTFLVMDDYINTSARSNDEPASLSSFLPESFMSSFFESIPPLELICQDESIFNDLPSLISEHAILKDSPDHLNSSIEHITKRSNKSESLTESLATILQPEDNTDPISDLPGFTDIKIQNKLAERDSNTSSYYYNINASHHFEPEEIVDISLKEISGKIPLMKIFEKEEEFHNSSLEINTSNNLENQLVVGMRDEEFPKQDEELYIDLSPLKMLAQNISTNHVNIDMTPAGTTRPYDDLHSSPLEELVQNNSNHQGGDMSSKKIEKLEEEYNSPPETWASNNLKDQLGGDIGMPSTEIVKQEEKIPTSPLEKYSQNNSNEQVGKPIESLPSVGCEQNFNTHETPCCDIESKEYTAKFSSYESSTQVSNYESTDIFSNGQLIKTILVKGDENESRVQHGQMCRIHIKCMISETKLIIDNQEIWIVVGDGDVVVGVEICVQMMYLGEEVKLEVSPKYAYDDISWKINDTEIEGHTHLTYFIKLIEIRDFPNHSNENNDWIYKMCVDKKKLGNSHFQTKNYNAAILCYTHCLDRLPSSDKFDTLRKDAQNNLGYCKMMIKEYNNAILYLTSVIRAEPNNLKALARISVCYEEEGLLENAYDFAEKAYKIEPSKKLLESVIRIKQKIQDDRRKLNAFYKRVIDLTNGESTYMPIIKVYEPFWTWNKIGLVSACVLGVGIIATTLCR
ncbi:hypothetical protein HZS_4687, partial [Henneguya salminicola]